jgi:IclR family acetate operon transcriptional repressor
MAQHGRVSVNATRTSFRILEVLKELEGGGPSDVASQLQMAKSTVHDHLQTLESTGYVVRDGEQYKLGPRFLDLGGFARQQLNIYQVASPKIEELAQETGHHANLMIEDNGEGVFLCKSTGQNAVQLDTYEGMRVSLHTTAMGKAILAHLPEQRVETVVDRHGLEQVTENTIVDREALFEELAATRERGYAIDDEERVRGMRCIAAPISGESETVVASVSVSGPTSFMQGERFESKIPELVSGTANIISVNLAYS